MLLTLAFAGYGIGLSGPLLFDDLPALGGNPLVQIDGSIFDRWRSAALSSNAGPSGRPVAMLSFAAQHALFGRFDPVSLKAVNLLLHVFNAILVFFLAAAVLRRAGGRLRDDQLLFGAFTAAAIWLLHPLHVSTVLYAVQRMAQLSTLFTLAGLLLFMRYRHRWASAGAAAGEILAAALWILLLTALAILSKENGALLLWLIPVLEVTLFRGEWNGATSGRLRVAGWALLLGPLLLVVGLLLVYPEALTAPYQARDFTLGQRLLTQSRVLWQYLGWLLWPDIRGMGFQHDDVILSTGLWQPLTTVLSLAAWLAAGVAAWLLRRRFPLLSFALLFYLVAHSMESGVLALELVFEHRNYLPSVALCILAGASLAHLAPRIRRVDYRLPAMGVLAVLLLLLFLRSANWSDEYTLTRSNLDNHPHSVRAHYFHANALVKRYGKRAELGLDAREGDELLVAARHIFERMHLLDPGDLTALAMLYYMDTRYFPVLLDKVDWLARLEQQLAIHRPLQASDFSALEFLVDCFVGGGCVADRERLHKLLAALMVLYPGTSEFHLLQYRYLAGTGADTQQRITVLEEALLINPQTLDVYRYLTREYARAGDFAGVYESVARWQQQDRRRRELPLVLSVFQGSP